MGQAATLMGAVLITLVAVGGAAQAQPAPEPASTPDQACVRLTNINGYTTLDDRHLLLSGGASRHFLVTTRRSCYGLQYGAQVGLSFPDTARICNAQLEYLVVPEGGRCRIDTIEEVEDADAARRLIEARETAAGDESR